MKRGYVKRKRLPTYHAHDMTWPPRLDQENTCWITLEIENEV